MPTINPATLTQENGESESIHAARVVDIATQLNNELGDVLEHHRVRTVELAAANSQKKSWMIGASVAIFLFFLVLIGGLVLSIRPTQGDMDNAVKRESDKVVVANTALQACQVSKSTCTVAQSAAQPDSYGRDRDTGILLERSAQSDKKLDVLVARPQPKESVIQPARPAVVLPRKVQPNQGNIPSTHSAVRNVVPQASLNHTEKSNECRFVARGSGGTANLVLRNLDGKVAILHVKAFKNEKNGLYQYIADDVLKGPKKTPFAAGACADNQDVVRRSWPEVVKEMSLPSDCRPV